MDMSLLVSVVYIMLWLSPSTVGPNCLTDNNVSMMRTLILGARDDQTPDVDIFLKRFNPLVNEMSTGHGLNFAAKRPTTNHNERDTIFF